MSDFVPMADARRYVYEALARGWVEDPITGTRLAVDEQGVRRLEELAEILLEEEPA